MTEIPHFSLPFRFASPQVAVTEQDSLEEIADCVLCTLLYPYGYRVELPEFGLVDPTFSSPRVDVDAITDVIEAWEPRAAVLMEEHPDVLDELIDHVTTELRVRTED